MRLIVHFARFGPYHHARLRAVAGELAPFGWEVIGLQTASMDTTYDWRESKAGPGGPGCEGEVVTVFPGRIYDEIPSWECRRSVVACLDDLAADAVAVPGWGTLDARVSLGWCRRRGAKALIMSETREVDGDRLWWKEQIKRLMMRHVHGALVGGAAHRDYLIKLGLPAARIVTGYNVVDNAYFDAEAARWRAVSSRRSAMGGASVSGGDTVGGERWAVGGKDSADLVEMRPFFLASNRFIERKNLVRLIEAYAQFCQLTSLRSVHLQSFQSLRMLTANSQALPAHWPLCLLGDGDMKPWLMTRCRGLGLNVIESAPWELETSNLKLAATEGTVFFPGFRQIDELPRFYAHAGAFIHPALEEPWGLVINEAMACGLPVLSGDHVGAAAELIREGVNGWTFDATEVAAMAETMGRLASLPEEERLAMGQAGAALLEERCPTLAFARGLRQLLEQ